MTQVTLSPFAGAGVQFFDNNGQPLAGGKIYTYAAGTTTPQVTYTTFTGNTPHTNPIVLDSAGRVPGGQLWLLSTGVYKFVLETFSGVLIGTYDNLDGATSAQDLAASGGSNLIGFQQAGAGAVLRTLQQENRMFITPEQFGSVGDGATNDTTAIQNAINQATAVGGKVLLSKQYLCGPLNVSASLVGANGEGSLKRLAGTTGPWLNVTSSGIEVANLRIDGDFVAARCFQIHSQSDVTIRDNFVRKVGEYFVQFNGADRLSVLNNDYADSSNGIANLMPVDVAGVVSNEVTISGNRIKNIVGTGIHFAGNQSSTDPNLGLNSPLCRYSAISNNIMRDVRGNGIICQSWDIVITGNVIEDVGTVGGNQGIVPQGRFITVTGNSVKNGPGVGIDMGGCLHSTVTGNVVSEFAQIGIELQSCVAVTCSGNTVRGCGFGITGPESACIFVGEGFFGPSFVTSNITVTGNICNSGTANGQYGISVGPGCEHVVVNGNCMVNSATVAPEFISATSTTLFYGNMSNGAEPNALVLYGSNGVPEIKTRLASGNADFVIEPQGTGVLRLNKPFITATTPANFVANVGIPIQDDTGTVFYIPAKSGGMW
jgi:parallel beta-helix repeat protein